MRTDITDCCCEDLPDGTPIDRHVAIRIITTLGLPPILAPLTQP